MALPAHDVKVIVVVEAQQSGDLVSEVSALGAGEVASRDLISHGRTSSLPIRNRTAIVAAHTPGILVHAIVAAHDRPIPGIVLDALIKMQVRPLLVTFANPATTVHAELDPVFARDLLEFDLVLPDGLGMCLAIRLLDGLPARRVSFDMTSLAERIFEHACSHDLAMVLVGGAPGVAEQARRRLIEHYPGLRITGALSGFGDRAEMLRQTAALQPDILVCGMGSGRQEAFLLGMKAQGWDGWGFTCGGFLDQLVGQLHYYPRWIDRMNLRWAYRLVREPNRLWRRYLIQYSRFAWLVVAAKLRQ